MENATAPADEMAITVNGQLRCVPAQISVRELILFLRLEPSLVAVERNGEVVPRRTHEEVRLAPGDRLEVVTFVGGG